MMKWFVACALAALPAFAGEEAMEKVYINPSDIAITDQGIFVYQYGAWSPVQALFSDELGVFACDTQSYWECSHCGKCVSVVRNYCHSCLKPRYVYADR